MSTTDFRENEMVNTDSAECSTNVEQNNMKENAHEFTRENIEGHDNIRLVDRDEDTNLDLFCYVRCTDSETDLVKQCRGVVFHGDKVVMKAFSYTPEYNNKQVQELENLISDFGEWTCYDAYEGAILRMFYFSGKWFLSTHRKLDAFRSKWASRESFGTLFKDALTAEISDNSDFASRLPNGENVLERFQETLDKDKQYMFLLCNTAENRIVCNAPERPRVYHVGTFVDSKLVMNVDIGLPYPTKREFNSVKEACTAIEENVNPMQMPGLCFFGPGNKQVKVLHTDYQYLFRVRGNEPSIKFRYLQVRMDKQLVASLYRLYPEMIDKFDQYENTLYDIAGVIYNYYVSRYIKKNALTVPKEEFTVMKECHNWHCSDRVNNRISLTKVINVLNEQPATNLNQMIRRIHNDRFKKEHVQPRVNAPEFLQVN